MHKQGTIVVLKHCTLLGMQTADRTHIVIENVRGWVCRNPRDHHVTKKGDDFMNYIAVDDEPFALKDLAEAFQEAVPEGQLVQFCKPSLALQYAQVNHVNVAFLDIELGSMNGLVLAKKIKDILPEIHIIFVTSHEQYAVNAFQLHATGYLMKPATVEDIKRELTFLYGSSAVTDHKKVRVQTFGGFAVYDVNGKLLEFKRSKTLELFAYLVDRHGAPVTTREACAVIWEDKPYDTAQKNYFQSLLLDLKTTLRNQGAEDILVRGHNSLAIVPERLNCDSYRFLDGDPWAINHYRHDYLPGYNWAEFRLSKMEHSI